MGREDARKEREAQLLKRFDANGDGKLDATEKAAMEAALEKRQEKRDKK